MLHKRDQDAEANAGAEEDEEEPKEEGYSLIMSDSDNDNGAEGLEGGDQDHPTTNVQQYSNIQLTPEQQRQLLTSTNATTSASPKSSSSPYVYLQLHVDSALPVLNIK